MRSNLGKAMAHCMAVFLFACNTAEQEAAPAANNQDTAVAMPSSPRLSQQVPDTNTASYRFLKALVMGEAPDGTYKERNLDSLPFYIALEEEGMPYTVYYSIVANEDLNGDRIPDYIIRRESEGMLGGSAQTNSQLDYYIMKDSLQYAQLHSILTYAPFSYNIISDYRFDKGVLTVSLSKNFRAYPDANETPSRDFSFVYQDSNLYETSYLSNCTLGKQKDKRIFNAGPVTVIRKRSIDEHNFTETLEEKRRAGDTSIIAGLSGCDNTRLDFEVGITHSNTDTGSVAAKKELLLEILQSLESSTSFRKELTQLAQYYRAHGYQDAGVTVDNRLSGSVWIRKQADGVLMIRIGMLITENEKQGDNWEVLNRVK
ncbi:hypothetical protein LQ567_09585 [Niabella pedocola]|uniref:Lipoprotein n=1 Tax=Niabella pedocola TaxID=1752077 RepID=A0ABS8PPH7_9BACT|nr:hypothetical protein [Niabella pedocola]MCD2423012.1 hypothetical protein [Niabella pedocola]